jgi:hypothetical protein
MYKEKIMENNIFLKILKNHFFWSFSLLEKVIEICPEELWNSKKSGFMLLQHLLHIFAGVYVFLRNEKLNDYPFYEINGQKIHFEFEKVPEIILTKEDVIKYCNEAKEIAEIWFSEKDDEWLKSPYTNYSELTNFEKTEGIINHMMYHIGYCDSIFRESGMEKGVWNG